MFAEWRVPAPESAVPSFLDEPDVLIVHGFFHEGTRRVSCEGHVEVVKAYYSDPLEYLARDVWDRWDRRLVHVLNHRWEQNGPSSTHRTWPVQHTTGPHRQREDQWDRTQSRAFTEENP